LVGVTIVIAGISAISILQPGAKQPTIDQILNDPELFSSVDQLDQTTNPVALATVAFNQDNQTLALEIIAELLERNRLKEATEAIEAASGNQRQNPEFLYLLGRLQWQRLVNGSGDYSANDAARSWANALEQRPNEIKYQVALGFARYAQADYQQAFEIWERAVAIDQQTQRLGPLIGNGSEDALVADPIALNAYAGLALALVQLADQQVNFEQRQRTLNTAKKYYLMVIQAAPEDFGNSQSLATNWLWQESTIADWQVLQERVLE
ncbi:MAG: hypothetical protein HC839_04305, partial [Leptolyngbyaceae cyanobacterium RM2_2_21]|nr:hypothetical protein [Leptolyngbyaceae cyanobacterium RM2_2_21]